MYYVAETNQKLHSITDIFKLPKNKPTVWPVVAAEGILSRLGGGLLSLTALSSTITK